MRLSGLRSVQPRIEIVPTCVGLRYQLAGHGNKAILHGDSISQRGLCEQQKSQSLFEPAPCGRRATGTDRVGGRIVPSTVGVSATVSAQGAREGSEARDAARDVTSPARDGEARQPSIGGGLRSPRARLRGSARKRAKGLEPSTFSLEVEPRLGQNAYRTLPAGFPFCKCCEHDRAPHPFSRSSAVLTALRRSFSTPPTPSPSRPRRELESRLLLDLASGPKCISWTCSPAPKLQVGERIQMVSLAVVR